MTSVLSNKGEEAAGLTMGSCTSSGCSFSSSSSSSGAVVSGLEGGSWGGGGGIRAPSSTLGLRWAFFAETGGEGTTFKAERGRRPTSSRLL